MGWYVLACVVLSAIDWENELYIWVWEKAPNGWYSMLALALWPVVAIVYLKRRKTLDRNNSQE